MPKPYYLIVDEKTCFRKSDHQNKLITTLFILRECSANRKNYYD